MSQSSGSPAPDGNRPLKSSSGPRKNLEPLRQGPDWRLAWWYVPLMLLMLWVWQDQWRQMSVRSIPYSEFKQRLAQGEVTECEIQDAEIVGKIEPKAKPPEASAHSTGSGRSSAEPSKAAVTTRTARAG